MNTALTAVCVNPTRINKDRDCSSVKAIVRMYVHFAPMLIVVPDRYSYQGCTFAPYRVEQVKPLTLRARTAHFQHSFTVSLKALHNLDKYVRSRIMSDEMQPIWELHLHEMVHKYRNEIRRKYSTVVSEDSFDYTIEFCSEVV